MADKLSLSPDPFSFIKVLLDKLPDALNEERKKNKIKNYLQELRKDGKIKNEGKYWIMT